MPTYTPPPVVTIEQCAFEATLKTPNYGSQFDKWRAYVNADIIFSFGEDNALGREAFVERHAQVLREKFRANARVGPGPDRRAWESAGNAIGWGLRLGLITEGLDAAGERVWTLVRREFTFVCNPRKGYRVEQVQGLPPAQQAALERKQATQQKLIRTLDRKARAAADPEIQRYVADLVRIDSFYVVPDAWGRSGFVPPWAVGRHLAEVATTVSDAHHVAELTRGQLRVWTQRLEQALFTLRCGAERRVREPDLFIPADVPEEDADALGALA